MPLTFDSASHGAVAFGFFNIESDMLLLENSFFFATEFCELLSRLAGEAAGVEYRDSWTIRVIPGEEEIGDLMGAIHGIRHTGFIGELYRLFPFPAKPEAFRQKTEGLATRDLVIPLIEKFAVEAAILLRVDGAGREVRVGDYRFSRSVFHELIRYVCRGGYPRWENDEPPGYVKEMKKAVTRSAHAVYEGMRFR